MILKIPLLRYAASQEDVMDAEQQQYMLTHILNFTSNLKIVTNATTTNSNEIGTN